MSEPEEARHAPKSSVVEETAATGLAALLLASNDTSADWPAIAADLKRDVDAGNVVAHRLLGLVYGRELLPSPDAKTPFRLLKFAAKAGDFEAQQTLGLQYSTASTWGSSNPQQAAIYLKMAADRGDVRSMALLGELLVQGEGVKADTVEGHRLLDVARKAGDRDAMVSHAICLKDGVGIDADPAAAMMALEGLAAEGSMRAAIAIAQAFHFGKGVDQDRAKATHAWARVADLGNPVGNYLAGVGLVGEDPARGAAYLEKGAALSDGACAFSFAQCLALGVGVAKDPARAITFYEKAIELENADASRELGLLHYRGDGIPRDLEKAFLLLRTAYVGNFDDEEAGFWLKAAEAEMKTDVAALYETASVLQDLNGPRPDPGLAFRLFSLAAGAGHARSRFRVGLAYMLGQGVPKDDAASLRELTAASDAEDPEAQYFLGTAYGTGDGVPLDRAKAVALYMKSASAGYAKAQRELARAYDEGDGIGQDHAQAFRYYRLAATGGDPVATHQLALAYELGRGTAVDVDEAMRFYQKAALAGQLESNTALGMIVAKGLHGVAVNLGLGRELLTKSAAQGDARAIAALAELPAG